MTPWAGFWGLLLGTLASLACTCSTWRTWSFGSDLKASFWGAGMAFVTVVVAVAVTM